MVGQTIPHYRIVGKLGAAEWAWCTKRKTASSGESLPSNAFLVMRDIGSQEIYALDWEAP